MSAAVTCPTCKQTDRHDGQAPWTHCDCGASWRADRPWQVATLNAGQRVALEFASSETIRRAVVVSRGAGALGDGYTFNIIGKGRRIFVYDRDLEFVGGDLVGVLAPFQGL